MTAAMAIHKSDISGAYERQGIKLPTTVSIRGQEGVMKEFSMFDEIERQDKRLFTAVPIYI